MSDQKPAKRRVSGGRVTPKGTRPEGYTADTFSHTGLDEGREPSPTWVPVLMFGLLGGGMAVILLNYVGSIWDTNNGARAMQATGDTDFQIETRFLSAPTEKYQIQF